MKKIRFLLMLAALCIVLSLALTACTGGTVSGDTDQDSSDGVNDNGSSDGGSTDDGDDSDTGNADDGGSDNSGTGDGDNSGTGNTDSDNTSGDNSDNEDNTEGGNNGNGDDSSEGDDNIGNEGKEIVDLKAFTVITTAEVADFTALQTEKLLAAIEKASGSELPVLTDSTECSLFELNVGKTSRDITAFALNILDQTVDGDGYVIYVTTDAISIVGTTDAATGHAVKVFYENYVKSSDGGILNTDAELIITKSYTASKNEIINGDVEIEVLQGPVTLFQPSGHTEEYGTPIKSTSAHYPSIVVLSHQPNEADNGRLIAHFCLSDSYASTDACFMESTDGGATWKIISRPEEQKSPGLVPGRMAHLYELPVQVGDYPAGTLVFSSGSIDYSIRSEIWIWYSTDLGRTWTQEALVAEGGITRDGVWEPFTWYEDGWLYCFYSDETEPAPSDQRLVYKRSRDGVNWGEEVEVCSFAKDTDRPGMFVMTKMGNGQFFMVYEYYGSGGGKVYYKITNDISSWNPEDPGKVLEVGAYSGKGAPSCIWIPSGGECGTLIATAKTEVNGDGTHRMFVSFDYGQSWTTVINPLPYTDGTDGSPTRIGHSPSFAYGNDGTVYYLNTTDTPETGRRRIQFASFIIY